MSRSDPWAATKAEPVAVAKREERRRLRDTRPSVLHSTFDPLAVRAALVRGWRASPWGGPVGPGPLYGHPGFRGLLLPGVRGSVAHRYGRSVAQILREQRVALEPPQMTFWRDAR